MDAIEKKKLIWYVHLQKMPDIYSMAFKIARLGSVTTEEKGEASHKMEGRFGESDERVKTSRRRLGKS